MHKLNSAEYSRITADVIITALWPQPRGMRGGEKLTTGIGGRDAILELEALCAISAADVLAAVTGPEPPEPPAAAPPVDESGFWNVYTVRAGR